MNNKDITRLVEDSLDDRKKKEVIEWLLKNPKYQKRYHKAKAEYVAHTLKNENSLIRITKRKRGMFKALKYASVIALLLTGGVYTAKNIKEKEDFVENKMTLVTTAIGEKKEVVLSDGTKIIVNSNSALSYPTEFIGVTREVVLKGEAFFDVAENKELPFIVNTNEGMNIKVLGTTFNVKSYPEDQIIETTLVTGKVEVVERNDNKTVFLYPSQRATYVKTDDKLIIDKVNTEKYISWKDGKLIYDETPLREVIKGLERAYNIKFKVKSKELLDYKYKGVFDNLSIIEVIELFELSSPIKCVLKEGYIEIDKQK